MFGILNNKIQLSGTDIATPVSNLTVGYSVTAGQNLYINGPYSSLSGSLTVGRDMNVAGSISNPGVVSTAAYTSITGNTFIGSALNVLGTVTGTALQIVGPFASVTGNIVAGSALNVVGTMSGTALQITGPFASITGNIAVGSALNVGGTITGTALQIKGPFASITGNIVAGSSLIAATVTSQLLTVASTADAFGVFTARAGTGGLQVVNTVNPSLQIISSTGTLGELGMATSASTFCSSSSTGDLVLRSVGGGRLLLNTGLGSAAVVCSGTMVGINTSPSFGLDVQGNSRVVGSLSATYQIASAPTNTGSSSFSALTDNGSSTVLFQNGSAKTSDGGTLSATLRNNAGGDIRVVNTNSIGLLVQGSTGYIGINKTPSYQLDVNGLVRVNNAYFGSNSTSFYIANQNQAGAYTSAYALYQGSGGDTVVNSASGQPVAFKINNNEYMRVNSNGLVGIGTTVPGYNLDVSGSLRSTSNLLANNSNLGDCGFGSSYACFSHSSRFTTGGYSFLSDNGGGTYINCSSGNQINFRCNNSQVVTINSSGGLTCNALYLPASSGFTGYTSQLYNNSNWVASGSNISQFNNDKGYIASSGSLNINGSIYASNQVLAGSTMNISGSTVQTSSGQHGYLGSGGAGKGTASFGSGGYSLTMAAGILCGAEIDVVSDERTKVAIKRRSASQDLEDVMKIQTCTYEWKDKNTKGGGVHSGVIAQEVEAIFPSAVSRTTDYVPDIYKMAKVSHHPELHQRSLDMEDFDVGTCTQGDKLRIYTENATAAKEIRVLDIRDGLIWVSETIQDHDSDVFVWGTEVTDACSVSYNHILIAGIGAVQAIKKQMDHQQQIIDELRLELSKVHHRN